MKFINLQFTEVLIENESQHPPWRRVRIWKVIALVTAMAILTKLVVSSVLADKQRRCIGQIRERPADDVIETRRVSREWQSHPGHVGKIYMKEPAYWDTRVEAGPNPVVRILVVAMVNTDTVYCHLWFDESPYHFLTIATVHQTGTLTHFDKRMYSQYLYSCAVPSFLPRPTHVSITTSECGAIYAMIPVSVPYEWAAQHEFGVCASLSTDHLQPEQLIEWVELTRMLGVGEITINKNIAYVSKEITDVLYYYSNKGVVRVGDVLPPIPDFTALAGLRLTKVADFNSCMMKNMNRYEWLIGVDLDEFLVPRQPIDYSELMKNIHLKAGKNESVHSYRFQHAYHYTDLPADNPALVVPKHKLKTLKFRARQPAATVYQSNKAIINPRQCLSIYEHECVVPLGKTSRALRVPAEMASVHQYRDCPLGEHTCRERFSQSEVDDIMIRYKEELMLRVNFILKDSKLVDPLET